tara:strand:- start:1100 stop:1411 length:312 start_codon:yes stop_codon:yes gene_type:complete
MDSFWNASSKKLSVNSIEDYLNQSIHDSLYLNKRVLLLEVLNKKVIEKLKRDKASYVSRIIENASKTTAKPASHIVTSSECARILNNIIDGSNDNQGEENENI